MHRGGGRGEFGVSDIAPAQRAVGHGQRLVEGQDAGTVDDRAHRPGQAELTLRQVGDAHARRREHARATARHG